MLRCLFLQEIRLSITWNRAKGNLFIASNTNAKTFKLRRTCDNSNRTSKEICYVYVRLW